MSLQKQLPEDYDAEFVRVGGKPHRQGKIRHRAHRAHQEEKSRFEKFILFGCADCADVDGEVVTFAIRENVVKEMDAQFINCPICGLNSGVVPLKEIQIDTVSEPFLLDEIEAFVQKKMQTVALEQSLLLQPILNKIYDMKNRKRGSAPL